MIGISLANFVMLMMLLGVSLVCALWFYMFWRDRRRELHRRRIATQCRICGCTYATERRRAARISSCPSCGSLNERGGARPI